MTAGLHTADYVIIAGYFMLLTLIGLYFWRRMKHVRDFFTGGNAIPWWLAGVSFYLTGFSAFTFVAYSEMAYRFGFVAVTLAWSSAAAMAIGTAVIYAIGVPWLKVTLGMPWQTAVSVGMTQFLLWDAAKLIVAAGIFPAAWWVIGRRPEDR